MSDYSQILHNIARYVNLNNAEKEAFIKIIQNQNIRRRQFIVQPNFICQHQTYVVKGTLRAYFIGSEGIEHTVQFAIDDWFISDFNSYISQTPASLFVEALEDSQIQQIEYQAVENLCKHFPIFERFFRIVAQKAFAYSQKRILSNLGKTAEERYIEFLEMYPQIVKRVPQYALASYLGMTPEFLSKIRKKMIQK